MSELAEAWGVSYQEALFRLIDKPKPTPKGENTLRFYGHSSGKLDLKAINGDGGTEWGWLPAIFALSRTRQHSPDYLFEIFQTDPDSLEDLADICDQAEERIVSGMGAIGKLLAIANEPDEPTVNATGWLLRGLSDLYAEVSTVRDHAKYQAETKKK